MTTFEQYLELAELFLKRRATLVENIEGILNAKGKAPAYLQDRALLAQRFDECFGSQAIDSLEEAQAASGFRRREAIRRPL